jgi:uncharacterized protein
MKPLISRTLDLKEPMSRKSVFLFGPRQTGKTTLLKQAFPGIKTYSLLLHDQFLDLSREPGRLRREITPADRFVVIDEIQKLPELLDEIHWLIEEKGIKFVLTGSSARKLKHAGTNLLGGRAAFRTLHPFTHAELGGSFDLMKALSFGLLPSVWFSQAPAEDLKDYAGMYLAEEVAAEGLTRNLPSFSRFLEVAALCNGEMINYTSIANDAQIAKTTCMGYFQILKDTLLGFEVPCWSKTRKRKSLATGKFYFFDIGVTRALQGRKAIIDKDADFGAAFESYIFHELQTYSDYHGLPPVNYWRSKSGFEVDFILADSLAVEVKATRRVASEDLRGLQALAEEKLLKRYYLVCRESRPQIIGNIEVLPWEIFLQRLWDGDLGC